MIVIKKSIFLDNYYIETESGFNLLVSKEEYYINQIGEQLKLEGEFEYKWKKIKTLIYTYLKY